MNMISLKSCFYGKQFGRMLTIFVCHGMISDSFLWFNQMKMRVRKLKAFQRKIPLSKIKARFWFYLSVGLLSLVVVGFLLFVALFAWYSKDLPSPDKLVRRDGFSTRINDRNGEPIYDVYDEVKRIPVGWEEVPDWLKLATISIEDKEFYSHPGFSIRGMIRAAYNIIVHGKLQGGSTLTQQLIKNALLTSERKISRKMKEFVLALQTERKYSKDEILLMYLNEAPYGGPLWGVGAAAEQYFGKKTDELNLVESAILAGLPQSPSNYSPFSGQENAYAERAKQVLRRMEEDGYISKEEKDKAVSQLSEVKFRESKTFYDAPHFVEYVRGLLEERYGENVVSQGGLTVTTSLDLELQREAQETVREEIGKVESLNITNGAAIVMDPETGEILAMVGSKDFASEDIPGKFNVVTQALRQPGSAIKPVTYAVALERGYSPASLVMDVETVFPIAGQPDYVPVNYDGNYNGPMSLRTALGNSINVPAVKFLAMVGIENMLEKANQMGLTTLAPTKENLRRFGLAVTLGGGEVRLIDLASAYCSFANGGFKKDPVAILKVEDNKGKTLEEYKPINGKRVLSPEVSFLISDILSDNKAREITFGLASGLNISGYEVAVKTGTTNDKRDNWAVGWTPNVLVGVWVGNNDNSAMKRVASGISGATPIWRRIIIESLKNRPKKNFEPTENIVTVEVDAVSGYRAHDGFPVKTDYFIKGREPSGNDPFHQKLKLCRGQNKLATPAQIGRGDYEEKEFFTFKEEDPVSQDGKNRWQEAILAWMFAQSDERYHPPTEYCEGGQISISLSSPENESTVGNKFIVKASVDSINPVSEVKFYINEEEKAVFYQKPFEKEVNLPDGKYTIKAVAKDDEGNQADMQVKIGVNIDWDWQPSPTPTEKPEPSPTLKALPTPTTVLEGATPTSG